MKKRNKRVKILAPPSDPEILMSELYYRHAARHAYADYPGIDAGVSEA